MKPRKTRLGAINVSLALFPFLQAPTTTACRYTNICTHIGGAIILPTPSYLSPFSSQANIKDLCGIGSKVFWNMNWEMIDIWKTRNSRGWKSGERRQQLRVQWEAHYPCQKSQFQLHLVVKTQANVREQSWGLTSHSSPLGKQWIQWTFTEHLPDLVQGNRDRKMNQHCPCPQGTGMRNAGRPRRDLKASSVGKWER